METVLTDFNLTAADSEHIVDVFSEAMRRGNFDIQDWRNALKEAGSAAPLAGAKFEDVAASLEILGRAGIKGGEAGTALRNIFLGINSQLAKGAPLFEKYGIEVRKSDGTFKDFAGIIDAIKQRFKDLNPQQQTAFAQALVGKEAYSKLNQIIQKSPESFAGLAQEHENLSGVVEDASKKQLETVDGQLNRSKELINNFATDSEGTLSRWTANSIKFVNNAAEGWIIGFNAIGDVIDIATGKATADLRKFEAAARKAFDGVVQAATNGMNQVQSVVLNTTAKAQAWGLSLSRNLASGISKGNPGLESVARTTAGILAANLRHTTPKEGPLKDDNVWGAHFVSNLVKGIEMGMPSLNTVVGDLTSTLAVADVANNQPSSSVVNNNNSPTINVSARQANLDERGLGRMLERMRILNGGAF
jgi:hypothetical protein